MMVIGKQTVSKCRSELEPSRLVYIVMTVVRLAKVNTEVLITLNIPISKETDIDLFDTYLPIAIMNHNGVTPLTDLSAFTERFPAVEFLRLFLKSFTIHDWSLFK